MIVSLLPGEQRRIRSCISQRVYDLTKKRRSDSSVFYKSIHRDLKSKFNVTSYKEIDRRSILDAIKFIESWRP
ncbi:ORF6C domain-containing protein [Cytobacillus praedii]|uniref:ORF6C domain-containing protein n=1 Tax=Cytobacillus praedii TaxID=1742358 RepID=UPI002E23AB85|nr:ORF6C domain-containing protein [Cytobacillus praedii]